MPTTLGESHQYCRCIGVLSSLMVFLDAAEKALSPTQRALYARVAEGTKFCLRALPSKKMCAGASRDLSSIIATLSDKLFDVADDRQKISVGMNMFTWFLADITTLCPLYCASVRDVWDNLNEDLLELAEDVAEDKEAMYEEGKHAYVALADTVWGQL